MITKDTPKKLFLLDAFALIYRAYFAFSSNPRVSSKGLNTSAIFGFTNTLLEILNKEKPTHIAVVFDTPEPTVRHTEFVEYKAQREEMPDDLRTCIPYIIQLIEGFNIPIIKTPGFEADDAIGTLAKIAEQQGFTTYMMTPDKDYGQLVDENTFIYKPARLGNGAEILGVAEICKKWEIRNVSELIDILGLMGDKVDNIPGIPGVGEKTAIQLVKDFGTIENLLENTDKLKGKLKEKVENNKEKALQSKWLATIILDVPIEFNEAELTLKEINKEALRELFAELEFRGIAQKVLGEDIGGAKDSASFSPAKAKETAKPKADLFNGADLFSEEHLETIAAEEAKVFKTIKDINPNYMLCNTTESITNLISILNSNTEFCFDSETTSLDTIEAEVVGLSFAVKANEAWYVPVSANKEEAQVLIDLFKPLFLDSSKTLIGQNIKYDLQVLKNYGVEIKNKLWDTMVAHFLFMPEMRHNMNILAETYLDYSPISIEELIGKKGKDQMSMRDVPLDIITNYAAEDADVTLKLKHAFVSKIQESGTEKLFHEVELPLIAALAGMEREGINVDVQGLNEFSAQLQEDITKVDAEIQALAGTKFNISSPKQVGEILFEYLKIVEKPKKTKTGTVCYWRRYFIEAGRQASYCC
jgi:DNA polymerase-1